MRKPSIGLRHSALGEAAGGWYALRLGPPAAARRCETSLV